MDGKAVHLAPTHKMYIDNDLKKFLRVKAAGQRLEWTGSVAINICALGPIVCNHNWLRSMAILELQAPSCKWYEREFPQCGVQVALS